jgi:ubiquinone/menaquinone biosynthesis C-methylase UbiE
VNKDEGEQTMKHTMVEATHQTAERIQKYYAWRSSNYDAGAGFEVEHHAEALLLADVQEGQRVLDVACGTGRGTVGLAQAVGPRGRVDALDLSEAMMDQARAKIEKLGLSDHVHFKPGNARELPYPDETFDLVYNGYMFDLIPLDGFAPILKEFERVLKPGGKLVMVNMSKLDERKTFYETIYEKGWAVMPCRPVLMSPFLEPAGFTDIQRLYRPSRGSIVARLWGQEIVLARKLAAEPR